MIGDAGGQDAGPRPVEVDPQAVGPAGAIEHVRCDLAIARPVPVGGEQQESGLVRDRGVLGPEPGQRADVGAGADPVAALQSDQGERHADRRGVTRGPDHFAPCGSGLLKPSSGGQGVGEILVGEGIVGVEPDRLLQLRKGLVERPVHRQQAAEASADDGAVRNLADQVTVLHHRLVEPASPYQPPDEGVVARGTHRPIASPRRGRAPQAQRGPRARPGRRPGGCGPSRSSGIGRRMSVRTR
jgi:hypothetical protein